MPPVINYYILVVIVDVESMCDLSMSGDTKGQKT